jgi:hypothetical protein|eukprot:CAMPEP_0174381062 /NCGR_PEP_ID=MMETSP0811_2-20130205/123775_1 /TAXON_ID=73025 ORGANISM="Eutreptiella gymnastica-like, Strain CCMP1594" /NCGR_SAMPLE_ID=MMETSP0811_2 /ASSEMBLY_ACC=CAM_ASM_000667 /LENGTH=77 /DNA_ID=CAMNT_0015534105 /DNA_START=242 /DNA_END=475 /DNA_ORIENTATION=-
MAKHGDPLLPSFSGTWAITHAHGAQVRVTVTISALEGAASIQIMNTLVHANSIMESAIPEVTGFWELGAPVAAQERV